MFRLLESRTLTGKATDMDVASSAAIKVMIQRLRKAAMKRHPGSNFRGTGDVESSEFESLSDSD